MFPNTLTRDPERGIEGSRREGLSPGESRGPRDALPGGRWGIVFSEGFLTSSGAPRARRQEGPRGPGRPSGRQPESHKTRNQQAKNTDETLAARRTEKQSNDRAGAPKCWGEPCWEPGSFVGSLAPIGHHVCLVDVLNGHVVEPPQGDVAAMTAAAAAIARRRQQA